MKYFSKFLMGHEIFMFYFHDFIFKGKVVEAQDNQTSH